MTEIRQVDDQPRSGTTTSLFTLGINVVDLDRASAFYTAVLGMVEERRWEVPRDTGTIVEALLRMPDDPGGTPLILATGIVHGDGEPSVESFGRLVIQTSDVEAVCARVGREGGRVEREPYTTPTGRVIAMVRDPEGVKWELIESEGPIVT